MKEIFSTKGLPARARASAWTEAMCVNAVPMKTVPLDEERFQGQLLHAQLDTLPVIDVRCGAMEETYSPAALKDTREPVYVLGVLLKGEMKVAQAGREGLLQPGDLTLTDGSRAWKARHENETGMRAVCLPEALLRCYVGSPADLVGIQIHGSSGNGRLASSFLRSLWDGGPKFERYGGGAQIERAALELIASAYLQIKGANVNAAAPQAVQRMQIIDKIESELHDGGLTPSRLATELQMSPRNLHRLFTIGEETISKHILRRRLERCAQQLVDPSHARRHVADIAYSWGFRSMPHFTRAFRDKYGRTPKEYRVLHGAQLLTL